MGVTSEQRAPAGSPTLIRERLTSRTGQASAVSAHRVPVDLKRPQGFSLRLLAPTGVASGVDGRAASCLAVVMQMM